MGQTSSVFFWKEAWAAPVLSYSGCSFDTFNVTIIHHQLASFILTMKHSSTLTLELTPSMPANMTKCIHSYCSVLRPAFSAMRVSTSFCTHQTRPPRLGLHSATSYRCSYISYPLNGGAEWTTTRFVKQTTSQPPSPCTELSARVPHHVLEAESAAAVPLAKRCATTMYQSPRAMPTQITNM